MSNPHTPPAGWDASRAAAIIRQHAHLEGAMLPMLHALQAEFGWVPAECVPLLADALAVSKGEVHGCISFYHDVRRAPPGRHVLKLCRAESCQAVGADALHADLHRRLGVGWHGTTADGALTVEPVFCLGLCATGPAALFDGVPVCRFDAARLTDMMQEDGVSA